MVLRSAVARDAGVSPGQLRGPGWARVEADGHPIHGLVARAGVPADPTQQVLEVARALMTAECVIGGWAALALQGNSWFDGRWDGSVRPVLMHCEPGSRLRPRPVIQPFRGLLHPDEHLDLDGLRVTTLARAVFDEMRMAPSVREAVVALDMATSTTSDVPHCTRAAVQRVLDTHHKVRGLVQARRAFALGSSRAASPWETRTRLVAELDAGLGDLRVNVPVFDPTGRLLGVADLLDEDSGLVIESDGGHHREAVAHTTDNHREEDFERHGLVVCRATALDHRHRFRLAGRIAAAHRDAQRSTRRLWTTEPPPWWDTWTPGRRWRTP